MRWRVKFYRCLFVVVWTKSGWNQELIRTNKVKTFKLGLTASGHLSDVSEVLGPPRMSVERHAVRYSTRRSALADSAKLSATLTAGRSSRPHLSCRTERSTSCRSGRLSADGRMHPMDVFWTHFS
jgi:hypothetical protein